MKTSIGFATAADLEAMADLLAEHVFAWARGNGMPCVTLLADKNNSSALPFYEKLGFGLSAKKVIRKGPRTS